MINKIKKIIPLNIKIFVFNLLPNLIKQLKILGSTIIGVHVIKPNRKLPNYYLFKNKFAPEDTVIDVGCGFDADFSMYMIKNYRVNAVGIDPTLKHQKSLANLSQQSRGRFVHKMWAVSDSDGKIKFNESRESVSGSILKNHINVKNHETTEYEVESVTLQKLPEKLGLKKIKYLKLDIEGAEYSLIEKISREDLLSYNEIFIEFHHHALPEYSQKDTLKMARKMEMFGFKSFTLDNHDFLFYR